MKSLWILHKPSGICLYHQQFESTSETLDVDKDLFSGFVSAIMGFSQEVSKGKAYLKEIHLGPLKIVYDAGDLIIVTIAFDQDAPRSKVNDIVKRITTRFLDRFANRLPPKIFDNNVSPYAAFDEEITQIFQSTDNNGKNAVKNVPSEGVQQVALNSAVKDYLHGNQRAAFKNIDVVLKDKTGEEKMINNTLQMVKKFANRLGVDADFEPLFEKIRANTLRGNEDEYAPFK
jgi:hypothetical protein